MLLLNEERGEGKELDWDDDDVLDVIQDDILFQVNCLDIVFLLNLYIQMSKIDEKGDFVVMVKIDFIVWKCIKYLIKKKIQESFMEYVCSGEDIFVYEEMFMKNIVVVNEVKI